MPNKKSAEPEKSPEQQALEARVEAMMNPAIPDTPMPPSAPTPSKAPITTPDIPTEPPAEKILKIPGTAPMLSSKSRKQIPVQKSDHEKSDHEAVAAPVASVAPAELPKEPISIDKLDQITGSAQSSPKASPAATEVPSPNQTSDDDGLDDADTDKAVDDIVAKEGDIVLAVEDAAAKRRNMPVKSSGSLKSRIKGFFSDKRTWIAAVIILIALFAVPYTRYTILGLVVKQRVTVTVIDSKTNTPVSNATISLGGTSDKTDGNGKAEVRAPVGNRQVTITKQYYKTYKGNYFVGFKAFKANDIKLVATGRLVPVMVTNKISGQPLKGVEIKALGTTAKTDSKGKATIALPTTTSSTDASLKLSDYNGAKIKLEITDKVVKANQFELTPAGKVYFLSNLNGTIDVVKANLDGSDRRTVLEGTGREEKNTTSLLASRDWRYLVLKAKRDGALPGLYLIDTETDKVTSFDNSNAEFTLVGWYGHNFVYDLVKNGVSNWQTGREQLKSYDADNRQLNQLDQNQAEGETSSYAQQSFINFYIVNGYVVYNTQWYSYSAGGAARDMSDKNDTIRAVQPNGQGKKDYQTFATGSIGYIQATLYEPHGVYYAIYNNNDNKTTYYAYEGQAVKSVTGIDQNNFNQGYPTFLLSPSGTRTFWTELRDGKNTLFTGDAEAKHAKQIAGRSEYSPYGWYSDAYTLVSKNSSELYIMPANGSAVPSSRPPLKITDYYKPAQTYTGYGYGYGGL